MPLEEDAPGQVQAPARALCKYHTRTPARWLCAGCHKTFCDLCVASRPGTGGAQKFCRGCGATCNELQLSFEAPKEKTFFSELPRAVIYPFRGTGVLVLIVTTIVFAALEFLSAGWAGILIKMAALGYVFSYVQNIIHSTASGDDKLPELPAMEGLFGSFFRLAGTLLVSFGPALVAAYLAIAQEMPHRVLRNRELLLAAVRYPPLRPGGKLTSQHLGIRTDKAKADKIADLERGAT